MPRKYMTRRQGVRAESESDDRWFVDPGASRHSLTVFELDEAVRETGLLNAYGARIVAVESREPIGFIKVRERS
jgi:hypothetical protein